MKVSYCRIFVLIFFSIISILLISPLLGSAEASTKPPCLETNNQFKDRIKYLTDNVWQCVQHLDAVKEAEKNVSRSLAKLVSEDISVSPEIVPRYLSDSLNTYLENNQQDLSTDVLMFGRYVVENLNLAAKTENHAERVWSQDFWKIQRSGYLGDRYFPVKNYLKGCLSVVESDLSKSSQDCAKNYNVFLTIIGHVELTRWFIARYGDVQWKVDAANIKNTLELWNAYHLTGPLPNPLELRLNKNCLTSCIPSEQKDIFGNPIGFRDVPKTRMIAFHPEVGIAAIANSPQNESLKAVLVIEWFGKYWINDGYGFALSTVHTVDSETLIAGGGVSFHTDNWGFTLATIDNQFSFILNFDVYKAFIRCFGEGYKADILGMLLD